MPATLSPPASAQDGPRAQILMVDDEPKNLVALTAVLEPLGQSLLSATSGSEALRQVLRGDLAVIVLDIQMPGMDGFETAERIRARESNRLTPIIFLTAAGRSEAEIARGYALGAVDYMIKPFIPAILRHKVKVLADLHQRTADVLRLNQELQDLNAGLERRVADRTRDLARSNEELAQFAAVASHDLQEPLRTLAAYLQLLAKGDASRFSGDDKESFDIVLSSARRMRQLINDLLAFSQIGLEGRHLQAVDCQALALSALDQLQTQVAERGAIVSISGLPTVLAEPGLLGQVFQNLISNALKFQAGPAPSVDLSARLEEGSWIFAVKDAGIGIDPEHNDKIFKLFGRLNGRDAYPGNGLGLSLCKKVVERHGGEIWLDSTLGQGSTFYFSIPHQG